MQIQAFLQLPNFAFFGGDSSAREWLVFLNEQKVYCHKEFNLEEETTWNPTEMEKKGKEKSK